MTERSEAEAQHEEEVRRRYGLALGALVVVQFVLGYEWLISGLTKLVRGGFPSGLAGELSDKSHGMYGWYWRFLDWAVIPNGSAFGYLIEWGELLIAVVLIASALAWLLAGGRLRARVRTALLGSSALAAFAGLLLNVAFHLANGSSHPWLLGSDPFDEGVDLDMFMVLLEVVLIVASIGLVGSLRRAGPILRPLGRPRAQGA